MPAFRKSWKRKFMNKSRRSGKYSRGPKSFAKRVKKVILKTAETKMKVGAFENLSLYHDRGQVAAGATSTTQAPVIWNPWDLIDKGVASNMRIGDEIVPRGMALRLAYYCVADRQAQFVRIIIAQVPRVNTIPGGGAEVVSNSSSYDLLDPAGSNDTVTGMIKDKDSGIRVLYDRMWTGTARGKTEDADELGDNRFFKKIWIRYKGGRKIRWQPDGYMLNNPIAVWVIPYDDYGTLRTDILGRCACTWKLYFKDP
jgi:hypothetical protein